MGAPWAAWETVRRFVAADTAGARRVSSLSQRQAAARSGLVRRGRGAAQVARQRVGRGARGRGARRAAQRPLAGLHPQGALHGHARRQGAAVGRAGRQHTARRHRQHATRRRAGGRGAATAAAHHPRGAGIAGRWAKRPTRRRDERHQRDQAARDDHAGATTITPVLAEPVPARDPNRVAHLAQNRSLIVRRSLLSTGLGGIIPLPVMDDYVASRVRAGLFIKLAESRHVDLPQASADLLSDPEDGSALRSATTPPPRSSPSSWPGGSSSPSGRRPWRRGDGHHLPVRHPRRSLLRPSARGRRRDPPARRRAAWAHPRLHRPAREGHLVSVFREAGAAGRSVLEAPRWMSQRLNAYAQPGLDRRTRRSLRSHARHRRCRGAGGRALDRPRRAGGRGAARRPGQRLPRRAGRRVGRALARRAAARGGW